MAEEVEAALDTAVTKLEYIYEIAEKMNNALQQLTEAFKPGPEYWRQIQDYPCFDWSSISAEVLEEDDWGATIVKWNGKIWKRRAPENEYGAAIWLSRAIGKENNKNVYATLIMFEDKEISTKVKQLSPNAIQALKAHGCKPRSQRERESSQLQPKAQAQTPPPPPPAPRPQPAPLAKASAPGPQAKAPEAPGVHSGAPAGVTLGCPEPVWKKAQAFAAMNAIVPDKENHCWKVGVPPNPIHTIQQIRGVSVCGCDDYIAAAEREGDIVTCAHLEAINIFKAARAEKKKREASNRPQSRATR